MSIETIEIPAVVIGGGINGCAVARELSQDLGDRVALLERNDSLFSKNQTGTSSEVLHGGHLYDPVLMPLKARHCVRGNAIATSYLGKRRVPHNRTGKILIATNQDQEEYLDGVFDIAKMNEVPGVEKITAQQIREMERDIRGTVGLHIPSSGVVYAPGWAQELARDARDNGAHIKMRQEVLSIEASRGGAGILVRVADHNEKGKEYNIEARVVVNAAGLDAVRLAKMLDPDLPYTSRADRGEAASFDRRTPGCYASRNIYLTPLGYFKDGSVAKVPFKELLELCRKREAILWTNIHITPTIDHNGAITYVLTLCPAKTPNVAPDDFGQVVPTKPMSVYHDVFKEAMPGLRLEHLSFYRAGNMVVVNHPDFVFHEHKEGPMLSMIGFGTPGLTASMSVAEEVKARVHRYLS
ncbi:FAD-dependent oxidoreductase [Candidatus Woesearchaeota archaeon]|nr:FAD-dependent oxidoreductase [Candidatus Woesearchaeota archaeon]